MKSPLRVAHQFKGTSVVKKLIPPESDVSSFLLYDGTMELALAAAGRRVVAHTNKYRVFEFWKALKENNQAVAAAAEEFYPKIDTELFYFLQDNWSAVGNERTRAALFFILNRCSDSNQVSAGVLDKTQFNPISLSYIKNFDGNNFFPLWDNAENCLEGLHNARGADYLLIPAGRFSFNLFEYGKSRGAEDASFNHRELESRIQTLNKRVVIVYKYHARLFKMYEKYNIRMVDKYGREVKKRDVAEELVIANF
tara:strand:- start:1185 stop:1943 length:759 start_codon:yes stop_codon:yes gene_type:complete